MYRHGYIGYILIAGILILLFLYVYVQSSYAHLTSSNHLVCDYATTPDVDIIQADIRTHLKSGAIPTGAYDGYVYNDPPSDPFGDVHPTINPGTQVLYRIISQPSSASYTVQQYIVGESALTCSYDLQCKDSCNTPVESGTCSDSCNITLLNATCPQYNASKSYEVKTGDADTVIRWDDSTPNTVVTPQPSTQTVSHTYDDSGKYDVIIRCGSQVCHKRYHVVCQDGSLTITPTPLSTVTPTPAGTSACLTSLTCSHPCACDTGSSSYVAGGCSDTSAGADYTSGYGVTQGTSDGAVCAPGMVCCQRSTASSQVWFKAKDVAFHEKGGVSNSIPVNAQAFSSLDEGDCNSSNNNLRNCHTVNQSGVLSAQGGINLGMSMPNFREWSFGNTSYSTSTLFTPDSFIQYTRGKKDTITIDDPEDVERNRVNYLYGNDTINVIDDNGMQGKAPFVLLVDNGDLQFDLSNKFNSSNQAMVLVVDGTIEFKSTMNEVNGIFIANNFDFAYDIADGSFTDNTFWLNGNIISLNDTECTAKRKRADQTKPTCFFTFDFLNQFLPTLDLFSIRSYSRYVF